ncbi:MAG: endonuclease [Dysgonomonas sp.]
MKNKVPNILRILLFLLVPLYSFGQTPKGYYDQADQTKGAQLKTAMHNIIRNHTYLDFEINASYWWSNYFRNTDWNPSGYFWDMYSTDKYYTYLGGSYQNREHMMPRSWWGISSQYPSYDANGDLFNLYPANQEANQAKLNYPLGEVGISEFDNGVAKVGTNTYSGYTGTVFEPADEYKGDFARTYFYMVTCYEDYSQNWRSLATSMINRETYPVFRSWAIKMLLEWSRMDPVSQKEIDRNNAVYTIQNNRNPFIDYPELAEYIWGDKTDELFTVENKLDPPTLYEPTIGTTIDFGDVVLNKTSVKSVKFRGISLTGSVSVSLFQNTSGAYSLPVSTISSSLINSASGYDLDISYTPKTTGIDNVYLVITGGGIDGNLAISITGRGVSSLGIDDSFVETPSVYSAGNYVYFRNITSDTLIGIYSITGKEVMSFNSNGVDNVMINESGVYLVKIDNRIFKILIR